MNRKIYVNNFLIWFLLRIYEFIFVIVISFFWGLVFQKIGFSSVEKILWKFREIYLIWFGFSFIFLYWFTSFMGSLIVLLKRKHIQLSKVNFLVYAIHSTLVLLLINFFVFTGGIAHFLDWLFIWVSIGVFNYFSPKLLPKSLLITKLDQLLGLPKPKFILISIYPKCFSSLISAF